MFQISITDEQSKKRHCSVNKNVVTIGRAPDNDICIDVFGVSRYHARVAFNGQAIIVQDLDSTNGTFVNGKAVEQTTITATDQVSIGRATLNISHIALSEKAPASAIMRDELNGDSRASANPEPILSETQAVPQVKVNVSTSAPTATPPRKRNVSFWETHRSLLTPVWDQLEDETVSAIFVNNPGATFVERDGTVEQLNAKFSAEQLSVLVQDIMRRTGKVITAGEHILQLELPDQSNFTAVLPPLSSQGPAVIIRWPLSNATTIDMLLLEEVLSEEMCTFLMTAIQLRKNILISCSSGLVAAPFLSALGSLVPAEDRIVSVENHSRLHLQHRNCVSLLRRVASATDNQQAIESEICDAILALKPNWVVASDLAETEAHGLLQAVVSGNAGAILASMYASSPLNALRRLEILVQGERPMMPHTGLRAQICSSIDLIVQLSEFADGKARVTNIAEIAGLREDGLYALDDIFRFICSHRDDDFSVQGKYVWTGVMPSMLEECKQRGLDEAVSLFDNRQ